MELKIFIPIVLLISGLISNIPSVYAQQDCKWMFYDDGEFDGASGQSPGDYYGVKFSLTPHYNRGEISRVALFIWYSNGEPFNLYIFHSDGKSVIFGPLPIIPTVTGDWSYYDLLGYDIHVVDSFYLALEVLTDDSFTVGFDLDAEYTPSLLRSHEFMPHTWFDYGDAQFMLRAYGCFYRVSAVGGHLYSVNKLEVLSPYLIAIGLLSSVIVASFITKKWHDKKIG
ncbi:MAG: hypothetical protein NWF08_09915 [Candidatus Bathyarchaeota archaeon]|nr:hypothetical protein [Candidatus Bathyarchaeota archaeon]